MPNNGIVRKPSLKEVADFQLGLEKPTSFTHTDYIHSPPQTTSQPTKYKMTQQTTMCVSCNFDLKKSQ